MSKPSTSEGLLGLIRLAKETELHLSNDVPCYGLLVSASRYLAQAGNSARRGSYATFRVEVNTYADREDGLINRLAQLRSGTDRD